jgi:hypothetical protein
MNQISQWAPWFKAAVLPFVLIATPPALATSPHHAKASVAARMAITSVATDYVKGAIVIYGQQFDFGDTLTVSLTSLGDISQSCVPSFGTDPQTITCLLQTGLPIAGDYLLTVSSNKTNSGSPGKDEVTIQRDRYDLTIGAVGPQGAQGIPGAKGEKGDKGDKGDPGGLGLAAGQSCQAGLHVTGFDEAGNIICDTPPLRQCTNATFTASVNSVSDGALIPNQYWPGGSQQFGSGTCTVSVNFPSGYIDHTLGSISPGTGWGLGTKTGWSSCTMSVQTPNCQSIAAIGRLDGTYPACSSGVGNTTSTANAIITCVQ